MAQRLAGRPASHASGTHLRADVTLSRVVLHLLEQDGTAIVACDAELRVVAASSRAAQVLAVKVGEPLPPVIAQAVRAHAGQRGGGTSCAIARVPGGAAATVRIRSLPDLDGAAWAVTIETGIRREESGVYSLTGALGLTVRQRQLVALLRRGMSNKDIAASLRLTEGTVKIYLHELFAKLQVESRMQLVARIDELLTQMSQR